MNRDLPNSRPAQPRIGSARIFYIVGGVLVAIGIVSALAAAGGSNGAAAIGGAAVAMGGAVIAAGLLVGLFAQIEARMIEIQKAIVAAHQTAVVAAGLQPEPSIITLRD